MLKGIAAIQRDLDRLEGWASELHESAVSPGSRHS